MQAASKPQAHAGVLKSQAGDREGVSSTGADGMGAGDEG
jgi:hypothetical protein